MYYPHESFFLLSFLRGGTCPLHVQVLRPTSWAGPVHNLGIIQLNFGELDFVVLKKFFKICTKKERKDTNGTKTQTRIHLR